MPLSIAAQKFLAGPILSEIDDTARLALSKELHEENASEGTVLLSEGKPNDRLWFLISGTAAIIRRDRDGDQAIARIEAPGIFGATSFFRPTPPTVSIQATSDVALLTLDHAAHNRLRIDSPRAAEALALATVRVLAERFDLLDHRLDEFMAAHSADQARSNEWATFRARLFEEPNII
jgi:CRP/FNR family cyclic AMP-dependent transcriptional regulator